MRFVLLVVVLGILVVLGYYGLEDIRRYRRLRDM
jgi:hypothetical protein